MLAQWPAGCTGTEPVWPAGRSRQQSRQLDIWCTATVPRWPRITLLHLTCDEYALLRRRAPRSSPPTRPQASACRTSRRLYYGCLPMAPTRAGCLSRRVTRLRLVFMYSASAFPSVTHTFGPRQLSLCRFAQNKPLVRHVVVVAIPGLCEHLFRNHQVSFSPNSLPYRTSPCCACTPSCCVSASLLRVCGKRDAQS